MARDDYFVVVYKILVYLYECLKQGKEPDIYNILNAETYGINESYFDYIIQKLYEADYIEGITIVPIRGAKNEGIKITNKIRINPKGIEYLQENSIFEKVKNMLKELKDIIPRNVKLNS